jgi:hypothetical protein
MATSLSDFTLQQQIKSASTTIRNDASIILRMYSKGKGQGRTLEETLDSPLAQLNLITQFQEGRCYASHPTEKKSLPIEILGYAIIELFNQTTSSQIPIEDLMYTKNDQPSVGAVFRLTENALITKLENLTQKFPEKFKIHETSGIHQIYLIENKGISPQFFLDAHYESYPTRKVA